ncbi:unnamed protein product [Darwinula stevensoni]|uniref:Uncharacterized protein n=1 Tax=Darwinula stevensoni TaxID=69355 RepID=A0A7R8X6L3_9CRUS|nr:unnamed protein product [Darwinula stevensoni]CAG0881414.1 unnamed protein product [Darwinula stevensoni]
MRFSPAKDGKTKGICSRVQFTDRSEVTCFIINDNAVNGKGEMPHRRSLECPPGFGAVAFQLGDLLETGFLQCCDF